MEDFIGESKEDQATPQEVKKEEVKAEGEKPTPKPAPKKKEKAHSKNRGKKAPTAMAGKPKKKEAGNGDEKKTGLAVYPTAAAKLRKIRAHLELETGERKSVADAVDAAADAFLANV